MGHGGMLYWLPSREVIADAVEYMVNGHAADALVNHRLPLDMAGIGLAGRTPP